MPATAAERTAKRRANLRAQGLRPVTLWVHDTRSDEIKERIRRQCEAIAAAERGNADLTRELEGWQALAAEAIRAEEP